MRDAILYYPTIAIQDVGWLKTNLLVWDKVYRIVPAGVQPNDHPEVAEAVAAGHVRSITLEPNDLRQTSEDFAGMMESLGTFPNGLSTPYTRLHEDKIDDRLYPKLAALAREIDDGWMELPEELARGYMFYLAETVAKRRNLAKGTDDDASWTVAAYIAHEGNFDDDTLNAEADGYYTSVVLTDALPRDLSAVPMAEVLDFAERRTGERKQLRDTLGTFEEDLAECESRDHAEVLIADFLMKLQRAKSDFKRSMRFFNPEAKHAALTMGVSVGMGVYGVLATAASGAFGYADLATSFLMGAVAAHMDYGKAKRTQKENPLGSYLVDLDAKLASHRGPKLNRYASNMHDFIHD